MLVRNLFPFFILLFIVMGCTEAARQERFKSEERGKIVGVLNKQFSLRDKDRTVYQVVNGIEFDCSFKFRLGDRNDNTVRYIGDKTLAVSFCESTSEFIKKSKLVMVLTPENVSLIKNAGFEQVVLYDREGRVVDIKQLL